MNKPALVDCFLEKHASKKFDDHGEAKRAQAIKIADSFTFEDDPFVVYATDEDLSPERTNKISESEMSCYPDASDDTPAVMECFPENYASEDHVPLEDIKRARDSNIMIVDSPVTGHENTLDDPPVLVYATDADVPPEIRNKIREKEISCGPGSSDSQIKDSPQLEILHNGPVVVYATDKDVPMKSTNMIGKKQASVPAISDKQDNLMECLTGSESEEEDLDPAPLAAHQVTIHDRHVEVYATDENVPRRLFALITAKERSLDLQREKRKTQEPREVDARGYVEEFYEADDGRDEALLSGDAARFEWSPMRTFQSTRETFVPKKTGSVTPRRNMYDAFRAYWDDEILEHIVTETNRYASEISSEAFQKRWYPTNIHEILVLFAFWMMLGILRMPTIKSCFSCNPLLKTDVFRRMFTLRRYSNLCRALNFCNNRARPANASRLYLFGPIIDHLNNKFQANYMPSQNLSLDESLTLWKGILLFKQYIASKVAKYGIKTFELCEAATGYLWSFVVYTGKDDINVDTSRSVLKSTSIVIKLMRPLFGKGYTVYMDNWFNSPILARFLKRNKTDCVGTLQSTRRAVPPLVAHAKLQKGQFLARHAGDVSVLGWHDKKKVLMISTYHGTDMEQITTGKRTRTNSRYKPKVIIDYKKNLGGVDRKDQMLEPYVMERKRHKKWHMKLFKRLLNCSIHNSRILVQSTTKKTIEHLTARLELVDSILRHHLGEKPIMRSRQVTSNVSLVAKMGGPFAHWPIRISPPVEGEPRSVRLRCALCTRKKDRNKRTMYKCKQCDVPLCVECFEDFHK